jgi:hypothetical protein
LVVRWLVIIAATFFLWSFNASTVPAGAGVRHPAWAGKFYPQNRDNLKRLIQRLITTAVKDTTINRTRPGLRALIMPHAGYVYSGVTAAHAILAIEPDRFNRVVLVGPDHRVGFLNASVTEAAHWQTPLGLVPIGDYRPMVDEQPDLFDTVVVSDRYEHSLEVILPFFQAHLQPFDLIPVVLGPCDAQLMAQSLGRLLNDGRTLLVVSADLSHYLGYDQAIGRDRETLARILSLDPDWQQDQRNRTCGRYPIGVLLELARIRQWQPVLLHYSNSGDTAGDKDAVVGYAAVAFYGDEPMQHPSDTPQRLTPEQGAALVALARQTLANHFGETPAAAEAGKLESTLADHALQVRCGTFVTLKSNDQLRGCIGSLSATVPIVSGVRQNVLSAAFHDPRFPPLGKKELDTVAIEVSVLSEPVPLAYRDAEDLMAKLQPGIDGVIIKKGTASATFLPQVWEQLPQPEPFLSHLCLKAGLPAGRWRKGDLTVLVYQVQYFEEVR